MLEFAKKYASNTYSQNGEDGIIAEILNRLHLTTGLCCEFGAHDGKTFSNCAALIDKGWLALLAEADLELYKQCRQAWKDNKKVTAISAEVTPENVNWIVPADANVLNVDIEESCYNVWKALKHQPDVVIIEINSDLRPDVDHVSAENGANYSAMVKLGLEKGYSLICHTGNLIFVLNKHNRLFDEIWEKPTESEPLKSLELIDPIKNINEYFNTSWLPAGTPRPWEKKPEPPTQAAAPYPSAGDKISIPVTSKPELSTPSPQFNIGILVTATGNFIDFLPQLTESLVHFLPGHKKTLYVFTNHPAEKIKAIDPQAEVIPIAHKPFPIITLERFSRIMKYAERYAHEDYLFDLDADMRVIQAGNELLNKLTAVQHPLFPKENEPGSWEENPVCNAYVPKELRKTYICGAVKGGETGRFLQVCGIISRRIEQDLGKEIMATWHDESHWNWFFSYYPADFTLLSKEYCYPEELNPPYEKKIIALHKDKNKYR
jgi:histo-blood group ABO system transferase